ncbi:MAG: redoxin domain-containing protein [Terriglobia bacterium]|jgi:peroxiredoxin/outer membrane lipoprotein-sorting protein
MKSFRHRKRLQPIDAQNEKPQSIWTAKLCATLLLGLAALVPAVSFAAQAAPAATKAPASLTAEQILAEVSQTYRGLRSFRFLERDKNTASKIFGAPADPAFYGPFDRSLPPDSVVRYETDLYVSTPGKIRIVVSSSQGKILVVSSGRNTWAYIPDLEEYIEAAGAPLLQELWTDTNYPIFFVSGDLAWSRTPSKGAAKLRGEESLSLGGRKVPCYVVDVPAISWPRLWIDEQRFIVLQGKWHYRGAYYTWRLTKADLGPISNDVFQFVAPGSARRVDSFSAPASAGQHAEKGPGYTAVLSLSSPPSLDQLEQKLVYLLIGSEMEAKAHDFTLGSLGGETVRLDGLRGKIVVLDFWASWCEPCQEELAAMQKLHDELASKGVVFLGIDDESSDTVQDFVKAHGYTFPMLLDPKQTVHGLYGVRLAPTTVVIDRKGKIAARYIGAGGEAQLLRALKSAGLNTAP